MEMKKKLPTVRITDFHLELSNKKKKRPYLVHLVNPLNRHNRENRYWVLRIQFSRCYKLFWWQLGTYLHYAITWRVET